MSGEEYTPSWETSGDVPHTPPEERYGGGVGFEQDTTTQPPKANDSGATPDTTEEDSHERPAWAEGDALPDRVDLTPSTPTARCDDCLSDDDLDLARAVYQLPVFDGEGVFFALLDKHGLQYLPDSGEWRAADGLSADADGRIEEREYADVSYLTVRGPAGAVASFVEDLLDATTKIKRELRAPSLVEVADAAQEKQERVDDEDRLVGRDRAAAVVDLLSGGEQ